MPAVKSVASGLHLTSCMKAIWTVFLKDPAAFEIMGHEGD